MSSPPPGWLLLAVLALPAKCESQELVLAEGGHASVVLVLPGEATPALRHAALELRRFLGEIAGASFVLHDDRQPLPGHAILLGQENAHLRQVDPELATLRLGPEEYVLRTVGGHLVIAGGMPRGTLYGVYGLLDEHLGCRWFTPGVARLPLRDRLVVPALDEQRRPAFAYREVYLADCRDGDWAARNRLNGAAATLEVRHGGAEHRLGHAHTWLDLLPPEQYHETHPEYYALVGGRRLRARTQLCCTNPDVVRELITEVKRRLEAHPEAFCIDVSQMDWDNRCRCDTCQRLVDREGSASALIVHLVNQVAEGLGHEFPHQALHTIAYRWSRTPPATMRVHPRVILELCGYECCRAHALESCGTRQNREFLEHLDTWSRLASRLHVWEYTTDFSHYLLPFPDLHILDDNLRRYASSGVEGVFVQDCYQEAQGGLAPLRGYLAARLLWNPAQDADQLTDEYLTAVYGLAAAPIRHYLQLLQQRVEGARVHVSIHQDAVSDHLPPELLLEADHLWACAEALVAHRPTVLRRVQLGRAGVDYALLSWYRRAGQWEDPAARCARDRLRRTLSRAGIDRLDEAGASLHRWLGH